MLKLNSFVNVSYDLVWFVCLTVYQLSMDYLILKLDPFVKVWLIRLTAYQLLTGYGRMRIYERAMNFAE